MAEQAPVHDPLELIAPYKRRWVLPILKGLEELGGGARPIELKQLRPKLFTGALLEHEWQDVFDKGVLGWTRFEMVKVGLLSDAKGRWETTDIGRAC